MIDTLRRWADKLAGNFRSLRDEMRLWRQIHHKRHWARVQRVDNWIRGEDDKDGKLHALKNYWVEFARICPRIVAEGVICALVIVVFCLLVLW